MTTINAVEIETKLIEVKRLCNKFIDVWNKLPKQVNFPNNDMTYGRVWGAAVASETILSILDRSYDNAPANEDNNQ